MLENKKVKCNFGGRLGLMNVHYSRLIASWVNSGGDRHKYLFEDWLISLGLDERDVRNCNEMYIMGKFEAERSAEKFLEEHKYDDFY